MTCLCCGSVSVIDIHERWRKCTYCGVYINREYHDTPIQEPSGISLTIKGVLADIEKFAPILDRIGTTGRVYDVCSGIGTLPYLCKLRGYPTATGNDVSPAAIHWAANLFGVALQLGEFEAVPIEHRYDAVVFHHGIEHCYNPRQAINKAIGMVGSGGSVYLCHPAMRDEEWLFRFGSGGHRHEWTFEAFGKFLEQFAPDIEIVGSGQSVWRDTDAGQWWLVRKR